MLTRKWYATEDTNGNPTVKMLNPIFKPNHSLPIAYAFLFLVTLCSHSTPFEGGTGKDSSAKDNQLGLAFIE